MTTSRAVLFSILILLVGILWYGKMQWYDKHQLANATEEVRQLIAADKLREGDIIFQTSTSSQSQAIQMATHSVYSHCGMLFKKGNDFYVYEAVQPVKSTPLNSWIAHGKHGDYVIKRLKNSEKVLTPMVLAKMKSVSNEHRGKNYDLYFEWSDTKMYCSEIIWKVYQRATGIEVGKLQQLKDFDLNNPIVQYKMHQRYGNHIPMNETVISPAAIYASNLLETVVSN